MLAVILTKRSYYGYTYTFKDVRPLIMFTHVVAVECLPVQMQVIWTER